MKTENKLLSPPGPVLKSVSGRGGSAERDVSKYVEVSTGLLAPEMTKKPAVFLAQPKNRLADAGYGYVRIKL